GDYVRCPNQKKDERTHVCRVIKPTSGEFWVGLESLIYRYESEFSPFRWQYFGYSFRGKVGVYNVLRLVAILLMALAISVMDEFGAPGWLEAVPVGVTILILLDLLIMNTSVVFISRFSANALRSTLTMVFGYAQFIICFGLFYYSSKQGFIVNLSAGDEFSLNFFEGVYFSMVTATTLGYGDISPMNGQYKEQAIVMVQLLISLYYGAIILGGVASWINEPKHLKPARILHPVEDILADTENEK
ncbi:MAG: potassium channel family protein, partial [Pseudomonadales bacterium]